MIVESFALSIVQSVLSKYIAGLITKRLTERNRAEMIGLIQSQVQSTRSLESKVEALSLAVQELDVIVRMDRNLQWRGDELVLRPSGRIRRSMPSAQEALDELTEAVTARRRELGLPLAPDETAPRGGGGDGGGAAGDSRPAAEGDLVPPDPRTGPTPTTPDFRAEIMGLPSEVLREKERRRRESERD